jgi:hypothetical protein
MIRRFLIVLAVAACLVLTLTTAAAASPGPSCSAAPTPIYANTTGTLNATSLTTTGTENLETLFYYNGQLATYGDQPVTVNPDGTWTGQFYPYETGKYTWNFENNGVAEATCSDRVK